MGERLTLSKEVKKMRKTIITSLAIIMLVVAFMPLTAQAEFHHNSDLYNSADPELYDHMFTTYQNKSININSDEGDISLAVLCTPYDETVIDFDYIITITLDDGVTNNSYEIPISATNTATWHSIDVDPTEFEHNNTGTITITLSDNLYNQLDYHKGTVGFYKSSYGGYMYEIIGLFIFVAMVGIVGLMAKRLKKD